MMHEGMPLLTIEVAERRVMEVLREKRVDFCAPINVEQLIQRYQASIEFVADLKHHQVEALIARINPCDSQNNNLRVFVDRSIADDAPTSYYRYVLAEEAGHLIADINTILTVRTIDSTLEIHRDAQYHLRERNREMIGRVLLSPKVLLEKHAKQVYRMVSEDGFCDRFLPTFESKMARIFEMPIEQMRIRIKEVSSDLEHRILKSMTSRLPELLSDIYQSQSHKTSAFVQKATEKSNGNPYIGTGQLPLFPQDSEG